MKHLKEIQKLDEKIVFVSLPARDECWCDHLRGTENEWAMCHDLPVKKPRKCNHDMRIKNIIWYILDRTRVCIKCGEEISTDITIFA